MLRSVSPLLSPDPPNARCRIGAGEEVALSDARFPADTVNRPVTRADRRAVAAVIDAILPLFGVDGHEPDPIVMMVAVRTGKTARYGSIVLKKELHRSDERRTAALASRPFCRTGGSEGIVGDR